MQLEEDDLSPEIAAWIQCQSGDGIETVLVPFTLDDINRVRQWLKKAAQNHVMKRR